MKKRFFTFVLVIGLAVLGLTSQSVAQFSEPEFEKVTEDKWGWFMNKIENVKLTGQGLYDKQEIDSMETSKIRARLQAVFGEPTKTLEDLINGPRFRPGEAIQFEYWFTVDDSIPFMILDVDGPFGEGLVYGGASKYIDLMPQIKRTFTRKLMEVEPAAFQDYFYSPERDQWFNVTYKDGEYNTRKIDSPDGMTINFRY
ncbi:hypothetical protein G3570_03695 [Balneolaceae bacterium YR4-1]|uniref:Uncharacterized protein n=1 Tax=Halalkalibaculum roseum TaxID=2709311 RepID=A0A6M1SSA8_9BACT|nr:hypothetical protein [Halalkalibaculum roseum]NGP75720.1 hypothetical protein [Halalkalibaculum roseum]